MAESLTTLFRPVGQVELDLVEARARYAGERLQSRCLALESHAAGARDPVEVLAPGDPLGTLVVGDLLQPPLLDELLERTVESRRPETHASSAQLAYIVLDRRAALRRGGDG